MADVNPIPENYHTITAHLVVRGAADAIEYYKEAFGAEVLETMRTPGQDTVMNATLKIGDSTFMLGEEMPMMAYWVSPSKLEGTTMGLHLFVEHVDAWFDRAEKAGLKQVMMKPQDTFWGDRYCQFIDIFGHAWSIGSRKEDLSSEEIERRAAEWMAQMANPDPGSQG